MSTGSTFVGSMTTYVTCPLHGRIPADHVCGDTPFDHSCTEHLHPNYDPADGDQMVSFRETTSMLSERCREIAHLHAKSEGPDGMTDGYCCECETVWPCRSYHIASGWGYGDECWDSHWCVHARVAVV